jgi:hypothetical protein
MGVAQREWRKRMITRYSCNESVAILSV